MDTIYLTHMGTDWNQTAINLKVKNEAKGSGCGSVGRAVASDTRDPRFESIHRQKFIYIKNLFTVNCVLIRQK